MVVIIVDSTTAIKIRIEVTFGTAVLLMLMYDKISFRCHLRKHTIYDLKLAVCHSRNTAVMGNDNESFPHLFHTF